MGIEEYPVAEIDEDGDKVWYLKSKGKCYYHNESGPAVIMKDGSKLWYVNDKRHRTDGPAVVHPNNTRQWYLNGQLHRIDGPAMEWFNGHEWYLYDKPLPTQEVDDWIEENNIDLKTEEGQVAFVLRWS